MACPASAAAPWPACWMTRCWPIPMLPARRSPTPSAASAAMSRDLGRARRSDIAGYLELHIEQGVVLQNSKTDLGLVTAIVGITRIEVVFEGSADHAGTTLMQWRRDASLAAAQLILFVSGTRERACRARAGAFRRHRRHRRNLPECRQCGARPRAAGVRYPRRGSRPDRRIHGRRSTPRAGPSPRARNVSRAAFNVLSSTKPTICDKHLLDLLKRGAEALRLSTMPLASGAGHDAAFVARIAPSAMLFIPCRDGKSHAPEEWTEAHQVAAGAATLYEAVRLMDGQNR